jgi:hypothetical protein
MMVPILLSLLVLQAEPPVSTLVERLGDDSIEVREKATSDLLALGEGRRTAIEKALKDTTAPEVAARLRTILGKFDMDRRRREFKGGTIVEDLGATLICTYDADLHQLSVTLELANLGTTARPIVAIDSWDISLPRNTSSSSSSEGQVLVKQLKGGSLGGRFSSRTSCGATPYRAQLILRPGERKVFKNILDVGTLTSGEYEVKAKFYARRLVGHSDDVESNALKFEIKK